MGDQMLEFARNELAAKLFFFQKFAMPLRCACVGRGNHGVNTPFASRAFAVYKDAMEKPSIPAGEKSAIGISLKRFLTALAICVVAAVSLSGCVWFRGPRPEHDNGNAHMNDFNHDHDAIGDKEDRHDDRSTTSP
jgi:hypothetical protein